MAKETLPSGYLEAGSAFDSALRKLGFRADGLLWAWDKFVSEYVLVLITRHFDHTGPTEMYRLLFAAYNESAIPAEISPFIVRLQSTQDQIAQRMLRVDAHQADGQRSQSIRFDGEVGDLKYSNHWVYYYYDPENERKIAPVDRARQWRKFRANVEQLAA